MTCRKCRQWIKTQSGITSQNSLISINIQSVLTVVIKYCTRKSHFYRPQHSCGKVMFSQVSVILFTWGVGVVWQIPPGQTPPLREMATATDGTHPTGMHSFLSYKNYVDTERGQKKNISMGMVRFRSIF